MKPCLLHLMVALVFTFAASPTIALEADTRLPDDQVRVFARSVAGATVAYLTAAYILDDEASPWPLTLACAGFGLIWFGTERGPQDTEGERVLKENATIIGMMCLAGAVFWHAHNTLPQEPDMPWGFEKNFTLAGTIVFYVALKFLGAAIGAIP